MGQFHHHERAAVRREASVDKAGDAGMIETGENGTFNFEARAKGRSEPRVQHVERGGFLERAVGPRSKIDGPPPTRPKLPFDRPGTRPPARPRGRCCQIGTRPDHGPWYSGTAGGRRERM